MPIPEAHRQSGIDFRDIVVASIVIGVRVRAVMRHSNVGLVYSNSFNIYRWLVRKTADISSPGGRKSEQGVPLRA